MRTLYLKMKTATGSSVYRNIAPQTSSKRLTFVADDQPEQSAVLAGYFTAIQVEEPALDDGKLQFKLIDEKTFTIAPADSDNLLPGGDSWSDTTDEKLVAYFTNGVYDYTVKLPHAATALDPSYKPETAARGNYPAAVKDYVSKVADLYRTVEEDYSESSGFAEWTSIHLTGTRDSVVAQPD